MESELQRLFGHTHFRDGQKQVITQLLSGHSSLAVFPTGAGKSLCYQFTATQLPHLTLVVSPLLALMQDQLASLQQKGIPAARLDSSQTYDENRDVMEAVRQGKIKILMVSVERFNNERFRQFIESVPVSMLVVDESHCISEWGHNFRPDYLKLPGYRQALGNPQVLLLTATATARVKADMAQKFGIAGAHIVQTGFYRSNLTLDVRPTAEGDRKSRLLEILSRQSGAGIVYVTLQQSAEEVARFLSQQGLNACAYHAGLDDERRQQVQQAFMAGTLPIVVATIAFGMGVDKADIRFVVHYDLPKSIENYSQEIGRAGRDGLPSQCICLANLDGITQVENFVYGDTPRQREIQRLLDVMQSQHINGQWECQLHGLSQETNIRQLPLKTALVQLELLSVLTPMFSYFAEIRYKLLVGEDEILARFNPNRQAFLRQVFHHTGFKRVWGELDMAALLASSGELRGRVIAALEYLQEQGLITLETKKTTQAFALNLQALTASGLAERLFHYFSDKEHSEVQRIAHMIALFESHTCLSAALAHYFDDNCFDDSTAPPSCGHCSVCDGRAATLMRSNTPSWPSDSLLLSAIETLTAKLGDELDHVLMARFFMGLSSPVFTRIKARQIPGFGVLERHTYDSVCKKLVAIRQPGG